MQLHLFLIDVVIVALALAALVAALRQHRRIVPYRHMLLPGLLSLGASFALVGYPRWTEVLELQRLTLAVSALLVGAVRGRTMKLASDRVKKVAALHNAVDGIVVAAVQAGVAGLDMVLDFRAGGLTPFTSTIELILITTAAYLLGRSLTLWRRVRTSLVDVPLLK
jgi:hypothetical protein